MTVRCRHRGQIWDVQGMSVAGDNYTVRPVEVKICGDCRAWLPLSPANDTEQTAIEIRAAELAVLSVERKDDPPIEWCTIQEWFGFDAGDDIGAGFEAGYLARQIHTHEEES